MVKVRQVGKFFAQGHPVEVSMRLRGREKRNKDWAMEKLKEFLTLIPVEYKKLSEPKFFGQRSRRADHEEIKNGRTVFSRMPVRDFAK